MDSVSSVVKGAVSAWILHTFPPSSSITASPRILKTSIVVADPQAFDPTTMSGRSMWQWNNLYPDNQRRLTCTTRVVIQEGQQILDEQHFVIRLTKFYLPGGTSTFQTLLLQDPIYSVNSNGHPVFTTDSRKLAPFLQWSIVLTRGRLPFAWLSRKRLLKNGTQLLLPQVLWQCWAVLSHRVRASWHYSRW